MARFINMSLLICVIAIAVLLDLGECQYGYGYRGYGPSRRGGTGGRYDNQNNNDRASFLDSDSINEDFDWAKQADDMSNLRDMLEEIVKHELEEMDENL